VFLTLFLVCVQKALPSCVGPSPLTPPPAKKADGGGELFVTKFTTPLPSDLGRERGRG